MTDWQKVKKAFKAYDIRGKVPEELNGEVAYRIGRVYGGMCPGTVAVGYDVRLSSPVLAEGLIKGLTEAGCDVCNIGLCGTEMIYFTVFHRQLAGGIMITASHNPEDYNGLKLVREESRPISGDTGLRELAEKVVNGILPPPAVMPGKEISLAVMDDYIQHILSYIDKAALCPLKVVVNSGNGCAGPVLDVLERFLPLELIKVQHQPDGTFPQGIPNPLLPENRSATREAVLHTGADIGIAWDGDFDRCFLFDEKGEFIEGYYIVGLLAESFLRRVPGGKIIHDPRLTWNTREVVADMGGQAVQCKAGHAFLKERMRQENAVYGGEMSAHHYFRDFAYCDSGMIPWLLVVEQMCRQGKSLSALVGERMAKYPCSGELNRTVENAADIIASIERDFGSSAILTDRTDGLSLEFAEWRFNVRPSNTEPMLRLNVESRGQESLMREKTAELLSYMNG